MPSEPTRPPTQPDSVRRARPPVDPRAAWALGLGIVSLLIGPLGLVAIGLGIAALRRPRADAGRQRSPAVAWVSIGVGTCGVLLFLSYIVAGFFVVSGVSGIERVEQGKRLGQLHAAMLDGAATDGSYPRHVAELILGDQRHSTIVRRLTGFGPVPGVLFVGDYDLAQAPDTDERRAALEAALGSLDPAAPIYRFGDFVFVRLEQPTGDPRIVFGWSNREWDDRLPIVFDDGDTKFIGLERWPEIWAEDAAARAELGLAPLPTPAPPAGNE